MQVTIDIPEAKYGELVHEAERLRTTVSDLLAAKLYVSPKVREGDGSYVTFPLIPSSMSGSMDAVDEDALDFLDPA